MSKLDKELKKIKKKNYKAREREYIEIDFKKLLEDMKRGKNNEDKHTRDKVQHNSKR